MKTLIEKIRAWFNDGIYVDETIVDKDGKEVVVIEFKKLKVKTLRQILGLDKQ